MPQMQAMVQVVIPVTWCPVVLFDGEDHGVVGVELGGIGHFIFGCGAV
jgi:hypothetical protein